MTVNLEAIEKRLDLENPMGAAWTTMHWEGRCKAAMRNQGKLLAEVARLEGELAMLSAEDQSDIDHKAAPWKQAILAEQKLRAEAEQERDQALAAYKDADKALDAERCRAMEQRERLAHAKRLLHRWLNAVGKADELDSEIRAFLAGEAAPAQEQERNEDPPRCRCGAKGTHEDFVVCLAGYCDVCWAKKVKAAEDYMKSVGQPEEEQEKTEGP